MQSSQKDDDGADRPVAYFSRKLLPRETRYSSIEKECLAIVAAVKHFAVYLTGTSFLIETDHQALQYLQTTTSANGRLTRWSLTLQPFKFETKHRRGVTNGNAGGLSRQAWNERLRSPEGGGDVREIDPDMQE